MKLFSIGIKSYYPLFPLFAGLCFGFRSIDFSNNTPSLLFKTFLMEIGMSLSLILEMISLKLQSRKNVLHNTKESEYRRAFFKYIRHPIYILLIFSFFLMDLLAFFFGLLLTVSDKPFAQHLLSLARITEFFFVGLTYYIFFKLSIYRQHFLGLFFIIIGLLVMILCQLDFISLNTHLLFAIIGNLIYAFLEIIEKWAMDYKFLSPFELVGYQGLFGIIVIGVLCLIGNNVPCQEWMSICEVGDNVIDLYKNFQVFTDIKSFMWVITYILLSLGYNVFILLSNKHLGPTHRIICDVFSSIITMIITTIKDKSLFNLAQIPGIILILFGICIYNELIIIHTCNFDVNTKLVIENRASTAGKEDQMNVVMDKGFIYLVPLNETVGSVENQKIIKEEQ